MRLTSLLMYDRICHPKRQIQKSFYNLVYELHIILFFSNHFYFDLIQEKLELHAIESDFLRSILNYQGHQLYLLL